MNPLDNLGLRWQLQDRLKKILAEMDKPLDGKDKVSVTTEEVRWVMAIQREWPEWARETMLGCGWKRAVKEE